MKKKEKHEGRIFRSVLKSVFWFFIGASLGIFFFVSFLLIIFQQVYSNKIYSGVIIDGVDFGGKSEDFVKRFFSEKNRKIENTNFIFSDGKNKITISAKDINFGYNQELLAYQAISLGRSKDFFSNLSLILQAYMSGVTLPASYHYSEDKLLKTLDPIIKGDYVPPVDALFQFENGKVITFKASEDGQEVDIKDLKNQLEAKTLTIISSNKPRTFTIPLSIKVLKPEITTDKANNLGIQELVGEGSSLFQHSIPNRIFNITLASTRLNGILIPPNQVFSFNKALGDVSSFTGYQQAYVIQNGRTVLGDGGGVCQVSTTLFRAVLNAGLPILERNAHAYRVGYYEQDSPPGLDATVYGPSVDFKFKNDTQNYILIQTSVDPNFLKLTFRLYGKKDGRISVVKPPIITSKSPAPPTVYQDDPTLPKGVEKQVDFSAPGASVFFTREVTKNGKTIISDKFISNYRPWATVFLRGTKE